MSDTTRLSRAVEPAEIARVLRRRAKDLRETGRAEAFYGRTVQATAEAAMAHGLEVTAAILEGEHAVITVGRREIRIEDDLRFALRDAEEGCADPLEVARAAVAFSNRGWEVAIKLSDQVLELAAERDRAQAPVDSRAA